MKRRRRIYALLTLPADLLVTPEVLGDAISVRIEGVRTDLMFPIEDAGRGAWSGLTAPLRSDRAGLSRFPDNLWGHKGSDGTWVVSAVGASVLVSSDCEPTAASEIQTIATHFDSWYLRARDWLCALHRLPLRDLVRTRGTVLRGVNRDGSPWGYGGSIEMVALVGLSGASLGEVHSAFARSTRLESLPLQHKLVLDARTARLENDDRRAVIDAGTAAEVALARAVGDRLRSAGIGNDLVDTVITQANGLMGLMGLFEEALGGLTVSRRRAKYELADKRNRAVHSGEAPTPSDAAKALRCARAIVEDATPLAFP